MLTLDQCDCLLHFSIPASIQQFSDLLCEERRHFVASMPKYADLFNEEYGRKLKDLEEFSAFIAEITANFDACGKTRKAKTRVQEMADKYKAAHPKAWYEIHFMLDEFK